MIRFRQLIYLFAAICQVVRPSLAQTANGCLPSQSPTDPTFADFLPSAPQVGTVAVIDPERLPTPRITHVFRRQSASYFAPNGSGYDINQAIELHTSYPNYVPNVSASTYLTFERHLYGGQTPALTPGDGPNVNYRVLPYREIFTLTDRGMYLVLASQDGEVTGGTSNNPACNSSNPAVCDYDIIAGQIWALPKKSSDFAPISTQLFDNAIDWSNPYDPELAGQLINYCYYTNMYTGNSPVVKVASQAKTYAQISYTPLNVDNLKSLAAYFNVVDRTKPRPIDNLQLNFVLQDAMMVRHYSGCTNGTDSAHPELSCAVFEVHTYGRGVINNRCNGTLQPLGLIGIVVGYTSYGNAGQGDRVNKGFLVYDSE